MILGNDDLQFISDNPTRNISQHSASITFIIMFYRYMKFSSSDRKCEKAFNEYLKDKMSRAKSAFKELLQETKKITDKSLSMVKEKDSGHMSEIIELLSKDKRYLDLESVEGKVNRELEALSYVGSKISSIS